MTDIAASVLTRLKNKSKASGISYQQCLQLFMQEEFLRRLSKSKHTSNFVLKGGLLIYNVTNFESRATIDIDFLLRDFSGSVANTIKKISDILATITKNDYINMEITGHEEISPQRKYKGISVQIIGRIKNVRVPFNIDIGIGDVIIPGSELRKINTQLQDFEIPEIHTYSFESVIAEKFDAILQRFELTGRMKDFYDIYYIARTFNFNGEILQSAIIGTLINRSTPHDKDSFIRVAMLADDSDMKIRWKYFQKSIGHEMPEFAEVINEITVFLEPVYDAIIDKKKWQKKWECKKKQWCDNTYSLIDKNALK